MVVGMVPLHRAFGRVHRGVRLREADRARAISLVPTRVATARMPGRDIAATSRPKPAYNLRLSMVKCLNTQYGVLVP